MKIYKTIMVMIIMIAFLGLTACSKPVNQAKKPQRDAQEVYKQLEKELDNEVENYGKE